VTVEMDEAEEDDGRGVFMIVSCFPVSSLRSIATSTVKGYTKVSPVALAFSRPPDIYSLSNSLASL
jgi:hypothetical protein